MSELARASLAAALAAVLFGATTPASKRLLTDFAPLQLAGLLYVGAAIGVAPLALRARRRACTRTLPRIDLARLAGAALLGGAVAPVLLLLALRRTEAGSVSLLLNLELAATTLLGVAWFGESLGRRGVLGVAGVLAAGALLSLGGGAPTLGAGLLVAAACACWGLDNQWTSLIGGLAPAETTFWKGAAAGLTNLSLGLALEPLRPGPAAIGAALAVGAAGYGASLVLLIGAAQRLGATRSQAIFASAPFVGAALSVALLGEPFGRLAALAAVLLGASTALVLSDRHHHLHLHEATEHVHRHRHDDGHHDHAHPGLSPETEHAHWHRHAPLAHAHPHGADLHHRHGH